MSSPEPVWLYLKCPACATIAKSSVNIQATELECPGCHDRIPVDSAERVEPAGLSTRAVAELSHLPQARTAAPEGVSVRGREEWERGAREKNFDLKGRLRSVEDEDLKPDPDNPVMKRRSHRKDRKARQLSHFEKEEEGLEVAPQRRRSSSRRAAKLMPWLIGSIVVLVAVLAVLIVRQLFPGDAVPAVAVKMKPGTAPEGGGILPKAPGAAAPDPLAMDTDSVQEHMPGIRKAIDGFAGAATVDEMLPFIRDSQRLAPDVKAYHTGALAWQPLKLRPYSYDRVMVDGRFASVLLENLNFETIALAVERTADGFLVDWEAWTGRGDMTWAELVEKRPDQPVLMRAVISAGPPDSPRLFYGGKFAEQTHLCMELADIGRHHVIFGYSLRLSQVAQDLAAAAADQPVDPLTGMVTFRGIVRVRYPAGAEDRTQVEIEEFVERGWVYRPDRSVH